MTLYSQFHTGKYRNRFRSIAEVNRSLQYGAKIRSVSKNLWNGIISPFQFRIVLTTIVASGLTRAWKMGARDAGIKDGELTEDELNALAEMIAKEEGFIPGFAQFIVNNSRVRGGKWKRISARTSLWEKRFLDARNQGKLKAQNDPKLEWNLGKAEKHCVSCSRLNGKVKRASQWDKAGYAPQQPPNSALECGGYNCTCSFSKTDKSMSKGPLPKL